MITWQLTTTSTGQALAVAFPDGQVVTVPGTHPTFDPLTRHLRGTTDPDPGRVRELLNVGATTAGELRQLSTRVTYTGGLIHFDGQALDNALTRHLVRLIRDGDHSYGRLVAFLENLAENPSGRSRRQLFSWLADRDMTITPDGQFIAYKGVRDDLGNTSIHSGSASVDGREHQGHIPNRVGSVITMPRNQVSDDKHTGCTTGLHVGTWDYASTFGRRTLIVSVNPRDVVSVPKDCEFQKLRCCRYVVLDVIRNPAGHDPLRRSLTHTRGRSGAASPGHRPGRGRGPPRPTPYICFCSYAIVLSLSIRSVRNRRPGKDEIRCGSDGKEGSGDL